MAKAISSAWQSFWHTMTSNDRHASHDSPYRTGRHLPLPQSRHAPLTSVATSAAGSRTDLSSSFDPDRADSVGGFGGRQAGTLGAGLPYLPGMRSHMSRTHSNEEGLGLVKNNSGEIQMQSFSEGLPPPPPVAHSWKRIERWAEQHYEELYDNLSGQCTQNDINELEHELDCTLPMEVRESLQVHDGQERGGMPTGIIFGCMLLDCEEIVQEWKNWRKVNDEYLTQQVTYTTPQVPSKAFGPGISSSLNPPPAVPQSSNSMWREDLLAKQDSQPPNAIQKAYAHPAWIPLARDWGGNNLAVDLAPGPAGKWGQIIIFGRDFDCKVVVARSWAAFLANVADDFSTDKVFVNEETNEVKLREFKQQGVEPAYLDILRWRADQKYGRKMPRTPAVTNGGLRMNTNVSPVASRASPSPRRMNGDLDRGRSPQRFPGKSYTTSSPRNNVSSPLARVAEENQLVPVRSNLDSLTRKDAMSTEQLELLQDSQYGENVSPVMNGLVKTNLLEPVASAGSKENQKPLAAAGLGVKPVDGYTAITDEMQSVEI